MPVGRDAAGSSAGVTTEPGHGGWIEISAVTGREALLKRERSFSVGRRALCRTAVRPPYAAFLAAFVSALPLWPTPALLTKAPREQRREATVAIS